MKTKTWILLFAAVLVLCVGLSVLLLGQGQAYGYAEIYQDGSLIRTVDLSQPQRFTVENGSASNTITVADGKIAVTGASCPDHYCMEKGWQNSGAPIVCLPNRLVIQFTDRAGMDAVAG